MKGFRGGERPDHTLNRERALLAGDGALGLPEGGGPLPLQLLRLLGLLLPLGQDLNTKGTVRLHLINPLLPDKFVPTSSNVVAPNPDQKSKANADSCGS
jgi:hypothetical protein